MRNYFINILLLLTVFNLVGCNQTNTTKSLTETNQSQTSEQTQASEAENKLNLIVSILPQKYFVEKIGGELVSVNVMVQPGVSPETYEPLPRQLVDVSESSGYITIGVPFEEAWLDKIRSANSNLILINSGEGVETIPMVGEHDHHHHEKEDHHHHHHDEKIDKEIQHTDSSTSEDDFDPHIWLSPKLAKIQAENIYQGLVKLDPQNQSIYQQNLTNFLAEIDQLDRQIEEKFASLDHRKFIIYHPAWGYLADEYNLEQIPLELEGQEVTSAELVSLIQEAEANNIDVVFAQPQFSNKTAEVFAKQINGEVVTIDPLAENWSENLLSTVDKLARSMSLNN